MNIPDILFISAALINIIGIIGAFVPAIPGPPVSFIAMLLCCIAFPNTLFIILTILMFLFVVAVMVADFMAPGLLAKKVGGSRKAVVGSTVGLILGLFYIPWGLVIGPFLGAFAGEYIETINPRHSVKVAAYTLLSLVIGTMFKLITCLFILLFCIVNAVAYYWE